MHISKVKSVNLDTWTPEQVVSLQQMGNSRARAVYEANLPDNFRRPQNDSNLETFIRAKYEHKKYIAREWVPPPLPKVNWEKEIEEEIEKQKRKKKTVVEKKSMGNVEVPQLPKPKNPSPKPGRASSSSSSSTVANTSSLQTTSASDNKQTTDLLGLQNGEDGFSNFLSAPSAKEEKIEESKVDNSKSEEESFFNQTAPTEKEKAKLTKDSILALYGNAPTVANFNPAYPNQVPHAPYGGFPQQNFQNFSYQQNYPMQNGIPQFPPQNAYPGQFPVQNVNQFGSTIPAQNIQVPAGQAITSQFQFATQTQFQQSTQFQSLPSQFAPVNQYQPNLANQPSIPNPFLSNQARPLQFTPLFK